MGVAALSGACIPSKRVCADDPSVGTEVKSLLAGIDTFVVVMMENRSFDHFFGALSLDSSYPARTVVDGLKGSEFNLDVGGNPVFVHETTGIRTYGPHHDWDHAHEAFNGGRNDGFVRANAGSDERDAMAYHTREHLPVHYALADQYTVCDRWFSSVMGPTWPNRFYLHATTSGSRRGNVPFVAGTPATLWERLESRCYTAKNYVAGPVSWYQMAFPVLANSGSDPVVRSPIEHFFEDARNGGLPNFSLIDPDFFGGDLHPPHDLWLGEAFVGSIVRSLQASPQWSRSLLLIVFDEHGGFYDHVPPPVAADADPDFRQFGFRVPALVIGPTVRRGQVVHTTFDHASVAATLRTRFGIESLGPRMDAASDISSCIDPERVGNATVPPTPPPSVVLPANLVDPHQRSWMGFAQELEAVRVRT